MSVEKIIEEMGVMRITIEDNVLNMPIRLDDYLRKEVLKRFPAVAIYYLEKVRENKYTRKKARLSRIALTSMVLREYLSNMDKNFKQSQVLIPLDIIVGRLKAVYSETNELYNIADKILKDKLVSGILGEARKQEEYWSRDFIKDGLSAGNNGEGLIPQIIKTNIRSIFSKLYVVTIDDELRYRLVAEIDPSPNLKKNMILTPKMVPEAGVTSDYAVINRSPLHLAQINP